MKRIRKKQPGSGRFGEFLPALLLLPVLLAVAPAAAVTLDVGTAAGTVGDTILLPVYITDLSDDVRAFELNLYWSATYAQCVGVSTSGTLSSGWGASFAPGSGTVTIAAAAALPLAGDGVLIELEMFLGPSAGTIGVNFSSALLNEGIPTPTLTNGQLQITALPNVDIYPDSGVMAVGDSLQFNAAGGTAPYTFTSEDPGVADFEGAAWLYALSPGTTRAVVEDADSYTGTTTGVIEVRAFRLRVVDVTVTEGETALVPVELVDPAGYGITAGEVRITWPASYADFVGVETAGTITAAAGWAAPVVVAAPGSVAVVLAGANALAGPGVLFYLELTPSSNTSLTVADNLFNEIYPALPENGTLYRTALPTVGVSPYSGNLRVIDQVQFTVTGSPTLPVVWSTDDPAVATISTSGLLSARGEGQVRVQVVDDNGATAQSGIFNVCSLSLPALASSIGASETVLVPVTVSTSLDGFGIYSYEMAVTYSPSYVQFDGAVTAGTMTSGWGAPTVVDDGTAVRIYHAGAQLLEGCEPALIYLEFTGLPGLGSPYTGVSLSSVLFNEGAPCALLNTGTACEYATAVPPAGHGLRLWPNRPNPFNPTTTIRYSLAAEGEVDLAVFTARGEHVRQLVSGRRSAGVVHAVSWDGRDAAGRLQASGVYYYRLRSDGLSRLEKMVLLK